MCYSWENLTNKFKELFPEEKTMSDSEERECIADDIFYVLKNEKSCGALEFRINYKNRHQILVDNFSAREYEYRTYYTDSIWTQRQRIMTAKELQKDLEKMQKIVKNILSQLQSGETEAQVKNMPVKICSGVSADDLLQWKITVPPYQRPYSWQEKNIRDFLVDIENWQQSETQKGVPYHLGTIILREKEQNSFDIIDGQQRLTTMAILAKIQENKELPLLNTPKNFSMKEKQTILRARNYIRSANPNIDFKGIEISVVILSKDQAEDLAYTFFSSSNSTGKRLSDYDLLKTHHLRYISSDSHAERFSKRWHNLEKSGHQDDVLQKMLFRLRQWSNNKPFSVEACNREDREIFNHYKSVDPLRNFPVGTQTGFRFNSLLEGGKEFFDYVEYYRKKYQDFMQYDEVEKLEKHLSWHSNGVICAGIKAIAFLFFCKFGDMYLKEAIYLLAYRLSVLRNEAQVRSAYLSKKDIFSETTRQLEQVTSDAQFFSILSDVEKRYAEMTTRKGSVAENYWKSLHCLMEGFEERNLAVETIKTIENKKNEETSK